MMVNPEWVGGAAALLTTIAYIPQVAKVLITRETRSLSVWMYVSITLGLALWGVYGVLIGSPSVMASNGITFFLAAAILVMKLRCG